MSVRYNVASLVKEPVGSTRDYDIDTTVVIGEAPHPITGHTTFLRTKPGVLVTARLEGSAREQCSRCLRDVEVPLEMTLEEEFFATIDSMTGATLPKPEEPEAFRIDTSHTIDLEEAVRQCWETALPMQPLCRVDCKGLCPRCGQDWNEATCSCVPEADERWSALGELLHKMERA